MENRRTAIITGATSGIGLATARLLSKDSWNLMLIGRNLQRLQSIQNELQPNSNIFIYVIDLLKSEEIHTFGRELSHFPLEISLLINCAGIGKEDAVENYTVSEWNDTFSTNVTAPFLLSQIVIQHWKKRHKKGMIINVGSIFSIMAASGYAAYVASKHALNGLTKALQKELKNENIEVYILYPGSVKTDFHRRGGMIRNPRFQLTAHDVARYIATIARRSAAQYFFPALLTYKRVKYILFGHPYDDSEYQDE